MREPSVIAQIPTHLIAGPLGSGKTTLLKHLMTQRPENERWAVLINEFGQVGIDAALLQTSDEGIQFAEIPGGCLCCVNGVPFQVGLARLLRRARPQRLFIEASGLGHPDKLMKQLAAEPWHGVLDLQPLVMVLDAPRALAGHPLAQAQRQSLATAGLIVMNKAEGLSGQDCHWLGSLMPGTPAIFCSHAEVSITRLPRAPTDRVPASSISLPEGITPPSAVWRSTNDWHCYAQSQESYWSIGWQIHPQQVFHLHALQEWLRHEPWQRAKGVLHTDQGWLTCNGLDGHITGWQPTEWRRDNRLELIAAAPLDAVALQRCLRATLVPPPPTESRNSP